MKNFFRFLKSRLFIKHAIILLLLVVSVVAVTFFWLHSYTLHGKEFPVPDFKGKSREEVARIMKEHKLRDIIVDSVFTSEVAKGTVFEQNPPAGFNVKKNRRVFLTYNAFGVERVNMPKLLDGSIVQAKADLKAHGLKIGKLIYVNDWAMNFVLKQKHNGNEIATGTPIIKGSTIDLVLGKGKDTEDIEIIVPSLYGTSLEKAIDITTSLFLNIDSINYDRNDYTVHQKQQAVVVKQSPWPGNKRYALGEPINVWLSIDKQKATEEKVRVKNAVEQDNNENKELID